MSTLVVFGDTADGLVSSSNATYATARAGSGLSVNTSASNHAFGQRFTTSYFCYEDFFLWDTSALVDSVVSACELSMWLGGDVSTTDFVQRVRSNPWTTPLTEGQWIPGENFPGSYTLLAHIDTNGIGATGAYKAFVDDAFAANVNTAGFTTVVFASDRFEAGTTPTGDEYVLWITSDQAGTTQDPKLTITYFPLPLPPRAVYDEFPKFLLRSN